jgi:hypothetical protein
MLPGIYCAVIVYRFTGIGKKQPHVSSVIAGIAQHRVTQEGGSGRDTEYFSTIETMSFRHPSLLHAQRKKCAHRFNGALFFRVAHVRLGSPVVELSRHNTTIRAKAPRSKTARQVR